MKSSWLIGDHVDRERMLDMDRRLVPVRRRAFAVMMVALIACGPWVGWLSVAPLVLAAAGFRLSLNRVPRARQPEYAMLAVWVGSEVMLALSIALSGGPSVPTMSWLAIPVVTLAARFPARGIVAGVAVALALLAAVAFGIDTHAVLANPTLVVAPAALILAVAIFSVALMRSDLEQRSHAALDPLTGMLNRKALATRSMELEQQWDVTGGQVGMIILDVDCFKAINDAHGHAAGDAVLRQVAASMRARLRPFDLAYRVGGDEFLVLVPGADIRAAAALAEDLCAAVMVGARPGFPVSMSCGVTASSAGQRFDHVELFVTCDAALYRAKHAGRNRVRTAEPGSSRSKVALIGASHGAHPHRLAPAGRVRPGHAAPRRERAAAMRSA